MAPASQSFDSERAILPAALSSAFTSTCSTSDFAADQLQRARPAALERLQAPISNRDPVAVIAADCSDIMSADFET